MTTMMMTVVVVVVVVVPAAVVVVIYILITNLMHKLLFIHKMLCPSTCFQAINAHLQEVTLYTCSIWYRHSLQAVVVAGQYTD